VLCDAHPFPPSGRFIAPVVCRLQRCFPSGAIETSTIQGAVSIVQLGDTLNGAGETIQVTFVTFLQNGMPFTIGFCGNQTTLFPPRQTVHVNFNPGRTCATVIVVVIVV